MSTMSDKSHTQVILILGSKTLSGSARQSHILLVCLIFAVEICTTNLEVKSVSPSICAPKFLSWGGFGDLPSRHLCLQSCSSTGSGVGKWGNSLATSEIWSFEENCDWTSGILSSRRLKVQPKWFNIDCWNSRIGSTHQQDCGWPWPFACDFSFPLFVRHGWPWPHLSKTGVLPGLLGTTGLSHRNRIIGMPGMPFHHSHCLKLLSYWKSCPDMARTPMLMHPSGTSREVTLWTSFSAWGCPGTQWILDPGGCYETGRVPVEYYLVSWGFTWFHVSNSGIPVNFSIWIMGQVFLGEKWLNFHAITARPWSIGAIYWAVSLGDGAFWWADGVFPQCHSHHPMKPNHDWGVMMDIIPFLGVFLSTPGPIGVVRAAKIMVE